MRATRAEIDMKALEFNFKAIRRHVGGSVKMMAIVKSNAYGHGIVGISRALVQLGIDYLGVGFLEEGIELRRAGVTQPILAFGGAFGEDIENFLDYNIDVSVSSIGIAERINEAISSRRTKPKVHIKVDTGMGRLGFGYAQAANQIEKIAMLKNLEIVGIYTHLATSDEHDKTFALQQLERFDAVLAATKKLGIEIPLIHAANSGAVLDLPASYYTMVRPGILMYGIYPSSERSGKVALMPALSFKSRVIYLKHVPAGVSISYGRKFYTSAATRIATIPIGYGDGYNRGLTNQGEVLIGGKRFPVVGAVTMDLIMVDIGLEQQVNVGDEVVLIGSQGGETISGWEIAAKLNTVVYEVFTSISSRVPRVMVNG
jgi:alanine racemase